MWCGLRVLIHAALGLCSAGGGTVGSGSGAPVGLEKALLTGGRKAEALQVKHALVVAKTTRYYIYVYTHICCYVHVCTYIHIYTHTHTHHTTHTNKYTYVFVCIHIYRFIYLSSYQDEAIRISGKGSWEEVQQEIQHDSIAMGRLDSLMAAEGFDIEALKKSHEAQEASLKRMLAALHKMEVYVCVSVFVFMCVCLCVFVCVCVCLL